MGSGWELGGNWVGRLDSSGKWVGTRWELGGYELLHITQIANFQTNRPQLMMFFHLLNKTSAFFLSKPSKLQICRSILDQRLNRITYHPVKS